MAGNALLGDPLTQADLLRLATEIEGHPDNAAAALLGGFTVSARTDDGVEAVRFDAPRDLRAVLFIPELRLPTDADARGPARRRSRWPTRSRTSAPSALGVAGLADGPVRPARAT